MTNLSRSITGISNYGGSYWAYKKVKADGSELITPDTWHIGTYREKTTYTYQIPIKEIYDESGSLVTTEADNIKVEIKLSSLDASADTLTFMKDETSGNYFAIYMQYNSPSRDSSKADLFVPVSQIETGFVVNSPGKKTDITVKPLENPNAITLNPSTGSLSSWAVTATVVAPASSYFVFNK